MRVMNFVRPAVVMSALALATGQHDRPLAILVQANASTALPASNRDVALAVATAVAGAAEQDGVARRIRG